jgi:hypothetical protein
MELKIQLKMRLLSSTQTVTYGLRAIVYLGTQEAHYTVLCLRKDSSVWFADGRQAEGRCRFRTTIYEITETSLHSMSAKGDIGRSAYYTPSVLLYIREGE